ncbi:SDR family oxidoreductase [Psychroflexus lacisalsi]|uniref:SDR family oxidoreductase n=1 Tax=Psychroflexus lacisalsi TaxID=503928 RepID=A0ABN1KC98_9FLAO|nr:SDR family oxidoreductase [Psychroflexus lacisalsi]MBZ9620667.1 SDR family oxidoreductase [Psychroflexus lacisalsi]
MKILLTGANGYIGMRVLPLLLDLGHEVVCAVRSADRLSVDKEIKNKIEIIEVDLLDDIKPNLFPKDIDAAYYLVHSMTSSNSNFSKKEQTTAENFNAYMKETSIKQVIFLSGIVNEDNLSEHLESRKNVESILYKGDYNLTVVRAGIIVGSGSASFEIIRDLCEKLPLMITPKWVNTKCQPIGIRDVLKFLTGVLGKEETYNDSFDIGGPNVLSYKDMMKGYAKVRGLNLTIINVPIMTPKLSSYWLYFVTSTSYKLAANLVDSMRINVIAKDHRLQDILGIEPHTYEEAIEMAFVKIEQNQVISSWKDSKVSSRYSQKDLNKYIKVPKYGCLHDHQSMKANDPQKALEKIWAIGGKNGWYYANILWKIRGYIDKLSGGVGLRRGRTNKDKIFSGDSLDFWRVLMADKEERRLLLFAEMRVPGEAWLEFFIDDKGVVHQNATFRPKGLKGRLYWYSMLPFHYFIFNGMLTQICKAS